MPHGKSAKGTAKRRASQLRFLAAYIQTGTAFGAALQSGVGSRTHREWLEADPVYREQFAEAEEEATQRLEAEARRRALEGIEETVYFNGKPVGTNRRYSDTMLIFLLKAKRPDVYRERWDARISGSLQATSTVKVIHEYHDGPALPSAVPQTTLPVVEVTLQLPAGSPATEAADGPDAPTEPPEG